MRGKKAKRLRRFTEAINVQVRGEGGRIAGRRKEGSGYAEVPRQRGHNRMRKLNHERWDLVRRLVSKGHPADEAQRMVPSVSPTVIQVVGTGTRSAYRLLKKRTQAEHQTSR